MEHDAERPESHNPQPESLSQWETSFERDDEEPLDVTTFRPESIELIDRRPQRPPRGASHSFQPRTRKRLALSLFIATCLSTFLVGMTPGAGPLVLSLVIKGKLFELPASAVHELLFNGVTFAGALILILFCHEMGHYLQARRYGVPASLPYFIPFPISPIGTMGAVIFQGTGVADRKSMYDIAISGPLAGLIVALPVTYFGLLEARIETISPNGELLKFGDPLILQWMVEYFKRPLAENEDVILNPLLFAGWVGIFITALNLIPIGQLDGGHILYTLIGKRSHLVAVLLLWGAVAFMVFSGYFAYGLMVLLLLFMGPRHPPTANDNVPLGGFRILLGWLTLSFIVIGFTPYPIMPMPQQQEPNQRQQEQPQQPERPQRPQPRQDLPQTIRAEATKPTSGVAGVERSEPSDDDSVGSLRSTTATPRRGDSLEEHRVRHAPQRRFMNSRAVLATWSSEGNIRRQIFVAAARSGRASPKASTISQPS